MKKALDNKYIFTIINIVIYTVLIHFILPVVRIISPNFPAEAEGQFLLILIDIMMIAFSLILLFIAELLGKSDISSIIKNNNKKRK